MVFEQLLQQVADARQKAVLAAQSAQDDRQRRREENDRWVTGGVNWNGYGLESLIRMVADKSSVGQLHALSGEWSRHGQAVVQASSDLETALGKLMSFWGGTAADEAVRNVTTNARWIGELGGTAQQMSAPIEDAAGALKSAQDTMPGMPKNNWMATAGGGAVAGFAVAGPIGAAFGAAIGGIASAFGFGNSKKKMKRKAVQTMERYEGALLGVDQGTPQFGSPSDGANPGDPLNPRPTQPIGRPGVPVVPPGGGALKPGPAPVVGDRGTDPSFAFGPEGRWQSLTGFGPGGGSPGLPGLGTSGGVGGASGLGLGGIPGMPGMPGAGGGLGGAGRGGTGARGAGGRGAGGRGARFPGGDSEYRGRGRFSKSGGVGRGGAGRREDGEDDGEHRRTVPIEEDLFSSDLKAAPPVIGI